MILQLLVIVNLLLDYRLLSPHKEQLEDDFEQFLEDAVSNIFNWSTLGAWGLISATICAVWEFLLFIYYSVIGCCVRA